MLWIGAAGACAGSFLNMLIYRLPRERSLLRPLHSYCPACESRIRFHDNIPLISYLRLAGRCRDCRAPIPLRYPLIEGISALSFMLILDAFCLSAVRPDLESLTAFGVTEQAAGCWSVLAGHLVLVAGLLAISAVDLEEYYVDVRITWFVAITGLLSQALHREPVTEAYALSPGVAGATLAAFVGLGMSWAVLRFRQRKATDERQDRLPEYEPGENPTIPCPEADTLSAETGRTDTPDPDQTPEPQAPREPNPAWGCVVAGLTLIAILGWACGVSIEGLGRQSWFPADLRLPLVFALLFLALVGSSIRSRPADLAIVQVIEDERHRARAVAWGELLFLAPALALGVGAWWWLSSAGAERAAGVVARVLEWPASSSWHPARNLVWAACSMLIGGAIGWGVRIFFTLLLGKEALGLGDVHVMWAAAAVTGWVVVVLGFFAAAFLAVLGMILLLGFKRSRAIPFGPWLALGILALVLGLDPILGYFRPATTALTELLTRGHP